jgi:hypothetical protein
MDILDFKWFFIFIGLAAVGTGTVQIYQEYNRHNCNVKAIEAKIPPEDIPKICR